MKKSTFFGAASEAAFSQVFQLGEAAAWYARTLWHFCHGTFCSASKWGLVVGDHPPPVVQFSDKFGHGRKKSMLYAYVFYAPTSAWHMQVRA